MKARLDGIYSPDLVSEYGELPEEPEDCWIIIHADIGPDNDPGADRFTCYVTTPKFLAGIIKYDRFQLYRGLLVVNEFDWEVVEEAINSVCLEVEGDSWSEIVTQLSRFFSMNMSRPIFQ